VKEFRYDNLQPEEKMEFSRLERQRDELLAAAELLLPLLSGRNPSDEQFGEQNRRWNASLAALRAAAEAAH
jgi:hypothetical protein